MENKEEQMEFDIDEDKYEIIDDTPEEDRDKGDPIDPSKAEVPDDEISQYSENVQKRIKDLKRAYHDERRAKEAREREREEAIRYAQQVIEQNKLLQQKLSQGEQALVATHKDRVVAQMSQAEREYKEAYEAGDSEKMLEAQKKLSRFVAEQREVETYRPVYQQPLQTQNNPVQIPNVTVDERSLRWAKQNPWFESDPVMRGAAFGIHDALVAAGYRSGSDAYYQEIDSRMREAFPHKFRQSKPANVVSPASRSSGSERIRLTKSAIATAKRLNIPLDRYIKSVEKLNMEQ
jgi:hypothetical protein